MKFPRLLQRRHFPLGSRHRHRAGTPGECGGEEIGAREHSFALGEMRHGPGHRLSGGGLRDLMSVTVSGDTIRIELSNRALLDGTTGPGMIDTIEPGEPATIEVPFQLRRRGVEIRLVLRAEGAEAPDDKLVALVARSHRWLDQLTSGAIASIRGIAQAEGIDGGDVSRFLPLACRSLVETWEQRQNRRKHARVSGGPFR